MKFTRSLLLMLISLLMFTACPSPSENHDADNHDEVEDDFQYKAEQFADLKILRYRIPGFEELSLKEKTLLYYLYEAALSGRDIIYDQNYKHNLYIRRTFENIFQTYSGDKNNDNWEEFVTFLKRVWFANGIHHHYSTKKLVPGFDEAYFKELVNNSDAAKFPLAEGESLDDLLTKLGPILFDPSVDAKRVNQASDADKIADSANNYYEGLTQAEVEAFYANMINQKDENPVSYGLNSKLIKDENGEIFEKVYSAEGMYGGAIKEIIKWIDLAASVAENEQQERVFHLLSEFYQTGDLAKFDEYNIEWVKDTESKIDVINGFIEVYGDALGYRGAFESVVQVEDPVASKRIEAISVEAQWFEDNSPIMEDHKKGEVRGISARVINVVMEAGDASPSTPIGINLPNSNWIRATHGSKSVNLANIVNAYDEASKSSGILEEFVYTEEEAKLTREHGALADNLHTDMHEVIGHASGKINPGVGTPKQTLKEYASTLEEGRADLVALYYLMDPKLVEMGVMPSLDVGKEQYNSYIRNGMMLQLRRIESGDNIEESHMRNRQMICKWAMEKGAADNVIERKDREGKSYFIVNDYQKLRVLFGDLLREIQRIKSEGDFKGGKMLVENYGVIVDQELRDEVHARVKDLNLAPYSGFINPKLVAVMDAEGNITDVKVEYPADFSNQHLESSNTHSFLPTYN